ncbi:MAG: AEC family transporter [Christensenellales bacterium]|jgi:predicted permease
MNYFQLVLDHMAGFGVLLLAGFMLGKLKVIKKTALPHFASLIVNVLIPCLAFTTIYNGGVTPQVIAGLWPVIAAFLIAYMLLFALGLLSGKLFRLNRHRARVHIAVTMFSNMGFVGVPLLQAVFPVEAFAASIAVFFVLNQLLLWTMGVYLFSDNRHIVSRNKRWRNFINPIVVCVIVSVTLSFTGLRLPVLLTDAIAGLGDASKVFAILYLGAVMAFVPFKALKGALPILVTFLAKTALAVGVFWACVCFMPMQDASVLAIIAALPTNNSASAMAARFGSEDIYAALATITTSFCCVFTIPLLSALTFGLFA